MRKLASIQTVEDVNPIEGADFIEEIKVLGWRLVSKKDEFKIGDKCVYFEIDSQLPDVPTFSFLIREEKIKAKEPLAIERKRKNMLRLRTKKMKGVISQGLALPLRILDDFEYDGSLSIGTNITEAIGVKKYEEPILKGAIGRRRPSFIPKTDEIRIQSAPDFLEKFQGKKYYSTVKLDGCSASYCINQDGDFVVCSRNVWLEMKGNRDNFWWNVAIKYDLEDKLRRLYRNFGYDKVVIQGEICGPGIQGNKLELEELKFFLFDVYDYKNQKYFPCHELNEVAGILGLETVPIWDSGTIFDFGSIEALLKKSEGKYEGTKNEREGLVYRLMHDFSLSEWAGSRPSFKVISNKFLLKEK